MAFSFCTVCLSSQMFKLRTPHDAYRKRYASCCNSERELSQPFAYVRVDFTSTTALLIVASIFRQIIVRKNNYCLLFPGKVRKSSLARRSGCGLYL